MKHPHDVIIRPVLTEASYEGIPRSVTRSSWM